MTFLVLLFGAGPALAAPFKAFDTNPQVVAFFPTGDHGVVGENATHNGMDLVMETSLGKFGNEFTNDAKITQQWFYGTANEGENGSIITEGDHSVWMLLKDDQVCHNGDLLTDVNTSPDKFWGDYLTFGGDYCVRTNDFHASKQHTP